MTASRYAGIRTAGSAFAPGIIEIPAGVAGYGELRNPETIYDKEESFFSVSVPSGGETFYVFYLDKDVRKEDFELWCCGYEDVGRSGLELESQLLDFDKSLPPAHPAGFPIAEKLEF